MDILLFIPDLVLEVGEWSSSWDTDRLNPRKSGALLGGDGLGGQAKTNQYNLWHL